jgi:ADP-ribose pyrophosphatase
MADEIEDVLVTAKFRIERRQLRRGGVEVERHVVVHPGAAVILPLLGDGRVVLIENQRVSVGRKLLELPAGTLEPEEAPEVCAARELEEETGYVAKTVRPLISFFASPGISTERMYAFVAEGLERTRQRLDPGELIEPVVLPFDVLLEKIRAGEVEDGKTIAVVLYYALIERGLASP